MTLGRFVLRNSFRNRKRTGLTVVSVAFSLFLLILLAGIRNFFTDPPRSPDADLRLFCRRSTSFMDSLPMAYLPKIQKVPHVRWVMPIQFYMGQYIEPKNFFGSMAVGHEQFFEVLSEIETSPEAKAAFLSEKRAALAGAYLMKKYNWKPGDVIHLTGTAVPADVELRIVGSFKLNDSGDDVFFRLDYLHDALGDDGSVSAFWLVADGPEAMPEIAQRIDGMFHNTPAETRTETERAFVLGFVSMLGNINRFIGGIAMVIMFTMLLVSASTMAMAIRERVREVGILKSLGFPRGTLLALMMSEAVLIALLGGILASAAVFSIRFLDVLNQAPWLPMILNIPLETYLFSVLAGMAIALLSALPPALQAASLTITQALKRVV